MKWSDGLGYFALMIFAVAAGQIGRLGQKMERGETIGRRNALIELSMLPAFGSIGGAIATENGWAYWVVLVVGVSAGWMGFATFRLIASAVRTAILKLPADKAE